MDEGGLARYMPHMAKWVRIRPWLGGYVRQRADGGPKVFVIERRIGGRKFEVSTRCTQKESALKQLAKFEADPANYDPASEALDESKVQLTDELVDEYRAHQLANGLTKEWAEEMSRCLADWQDRLGAADLAKLSLTADIKPALSAWQARKPQRIKALKGFFKWLRREKGLLTKAEDPTLDLAVPQARPAQWVETKVIDPEDVRKVWAKLPQPYADILLLQTGTAWHVTEVRRFVEAGSIILAPPRSGALAVLVTLHKKGEPHSTRLDYQEHVDAAKRLLELRGKPWPKRMTQSRVMAKACKAAGVPGFGLGQMRHSVLSWGYDLGADMARLRDFAGHESEDTTRKFYVRRAVPNAAIPLVRIAPRDETTPPS